MERRVKYFLSISFLSLAAFVIAGFASTHVQDWPFAAGRSFRNVANLSGPLGSAIAFVAFTGLGRLFAWIVPAILLLLSAGVLAGRERHSVYLAAKSLVIVVLAASFFALVPVTRESSLMTGSIGRTVAGASSAVLGEIGSTILLITCLLLILLKEVHYFGRAGVVMGRAASGWRPRFRQWGIGLRTTLALWAAAWRERRAARRAARQALESGEDGDEADVGYAVVETPGQAPWVDLERAATGLVAADDPVSPTAPPVRRATPRRRPRPAPDGDGLPLEKAVLPDISMLHSTGKAGFGYSADQLRTWTEVLEGKLANYGVEGHVTAVNQGPVVTTFEFEPAPGVKIKDIVSRSDDLALAMRARSLRLIAPIPGRAVVGIEIPNPEHETVYFRDVLQEIPERLRYSGVMIALGVDAIGKPFNMNLCSAPHLLMAGTTGSGKSVALNGFLASILFQYRPSDVRLLLIDPKMVEMTIYNGIPHLLHPVITDPREAVKVFEYLIGEMGKRNRLLRKHGVKNIESFNSKVALGKVTTDEGEPVDKLAYIVLVVDELADLVLTRGVDFESLLSRLSNMARAVGIHMIVATQRPSVDIIDGKTKANFPTRIAFRVATKVDSRTILDTMGAEKLLGKGDMLYVDAKHPEALRLHGAWISEEELELLVDHWKRYEYEETQLELYEEKAGGVAAADMDSFFDDAKSIILQYRQGSTSLLQRKLHVGYARAARLLDQLEEAGVVGPPDGSKPREVLISEEDGIARHAED